MAASMRGIDVPHFVVVHDVDGDHAGRVPMAGPRRPAIRAEPMREELYRACLGAGISAATPRSS